MTRVLLVGCTGSGRTAAGTLVASRGGWPFLDDDALLARTAGLQVQDLYRERGAEAVVVAQGSTLNLLLAVPGPLVATVASGVLLDPVDRERVRGGGHVVWLRASLPTLVRRVGVGPERPWLGDDPAARLGRLLEERTPLWAEVATHVVDVDGLPVGQVARAVVEGLPPGLRPA